MTERDIRMEIEYSLFVEQTAEAIRQALKALRSLCRLLAMATAGLWRSCRGRGCEDTFDGDRQAETCDRGGFRDRRGV